MSNTTKAIIGIVVVVVVVGGLWWWIASKNSGAPAPAMSINQTSTGANTVQQNSSSTVAPTSTASSTAPMDDSDASLNAQLNAADSQMNNFNADSASINQGINDQPVPQGQ